MPERIVHWRYPSRWRCPQQNRYFHSEEDWLAYRAEKSLSGSDVERVSEPDELHYLVRWEGYSSGEDTFEPLSNLEGNIVFQKWREARAGRTAAAIGSPAWRQPKLWNDTRWIVPLAPWLPHVSPWWFVCARVSEPPVFWIRISARSRQPLSVITVVEFAP